MRRDRRTALLIGLWAACVVVIGGAAVLVPARADAVAPSPLDLMVGWTLLVAGLACFRSATAAVLLTAAGVTWVAVGLAALIDGPLGSGLPRLALAPTAFLLLIVALLPRGRLAGPLAWGQALVLIAVTAIGGAGADAYAMAVLGSTVLVPSVARTNRRHRDRSGTVQLLVGGGILLAGVLVSTGVGAPELAVDIHASVMIGGATAVAWQLARPAAIPAEALELGEPLSIGRALGEMVGTGPVEVAFPTHDGSWIDPAGDQVQPDPSRGEVLDHDGSLLAAVHPVWWSIRKPDPAVRRFLAAAARGGGLRASLRSQAREVERSRGRLQEATDSERQRLAARINAGPVHRLATVRELLHAGGFGPADRAGPLERLDAAQALLHDLVLGLDPTPTVEDLEPALRRLVETHGGRLQIRWTHDVAIAADIRRAVWFTCAEALHQRGQARSGMPGGRRPGHQPRRAAVDRQ